MVLKNQSNLKFKMFIKQHTTHDKRILLAICDKEIKGQEIEEDGACLNLKADFFNGEEVSEETAISMIQTADLLNVVGTRAVELIKKLGLAHEDETKKICNIPYILITLG